MSDCNNCDPTCYSEVSADCVEYNGESIPEIGLEQGSNMSQAIAAVGTQVAANKETSDKCACGSTDSNATSGSTNTGETDLGDVQALTGRTISNISTSPIKINSSISGGQLNVDYNLKDAFDSLGGQPSSLRVSVHGKYRGSVNDVELGTSDTVTGAFSLNPENCPLTLKVQSRLLDSQGIQKIVEYSRPFPCETGCTEDFLNSRSVGDTSISGQSDVNTAICQELEAIKSQMSTVLNFKYNGKDTNTIIVEQSNTINTLESRLEELVQEVQSCKDQIDELSRIT